DVDMVSFTGSTRAGRRVGALAAETVKRVALELGGKSANILLPDADHEVAVKVGVANCYLNAGQTCTALSRMLVHASRLDEAVERAVAYAQRYVPGDPTDPQTRLGPLVSGAQRQRVHDLLRRSVQEGATVATGGPDAPGLPERGYYVAPTVLTGVTPDSTAAQEEFFGPVLSIIPYADEDEAVRIANNSRYGLAGAVWSADQDRAMAVARRLRTGQVDINGAPFNPLAPFGGFKQSGHGREFGPYGLAEFQELKAAQLPGARPPVGWVAIRARRTPRSGVVAAVLRTPGGRPQVEEIDLPAPGPGQVRVALSATGVCHSDLSLADGTLTHAMPVVLGHEGAGRVTAVGEGVTTPAPGDPVVLNWAPPCRECWWCGHGEPWLCARADRAWSRPYARLADGGEVYPGLGTAAFATETVVAADACVPLPPDMPLREAAVLGCAVLTGVGAVLNAARVRPGESVVVIGLGGVGLAALQGARLAGADPVIAVDPVAAKEELARRLGATEVLTPGPDLGKRVRALTGGRGADHAIECVGRADTIRAAWSATRRGGHATVVGLGPRSDQVAFNAVEVAHFARSLTGCFYGNTDPAVDVPRLVEHFRAGRLDLAALITDEVPLEGVADALQRLATGGTGARTVVRFA